MTSTYYITYGPCCQRTHSPTFSLPLPHSRDDRPTVGWSHGRWWIQITARERERERGVGQNGLFHTVSPFMELSLKLLPDWRDAYLCANWTAGQKHRPEPRRSSSEVLRLDNTGLWLSFFREQTRVRFIGLVCV